MHICTDPTIPTANYLSGHPFKLLITSTAVCSAVLAASCTPLSSFHVVIVDQDLGADVLDSSAQLVAVCVCGWVGVDGCGWVVGDGLVHTNISSLTPPQNFELNPRKRHQWAILDPLFLKHNNFWSSLASKTLFH